MNILNNQKVCEKAWEIIKSMKINGPWQEHIVHQTVMKALELKEPTNGPQWLDINEIKPDDGQRVLTWNNKYNESLIQVYNEEYRCWDTEDGDEFEFDTDTDIIQYWMPLPFKPCGKDGEKNQ